MYLPVLRVMTILYEIKLLLLMNMLHSGKHWPYTKEKKVTDNNNNCHFFTHTKYVIGTIHM